MDDLLPAHRPHDVIATSICAQFLQTTMERALTVRSTDTQADAAHRLGATHFSQAPVVDYGEILGCVFVDALDPLSGGTVAAAMVPLRPEALVTADAPISELLRWLQRRRFLFVLDGNDVSGFVVIADLNKQPARTYFYLLVSEVEMNIADLLRAPPNDPEMVLGLLSVGRQKQVRDQYRRQMELGVETDLIGAFMFVDLLTACSKHDELPQKLGIESKATWQKLTGGLDAFRNAVMHLNREMLLEDDREALDGLIRRDHNLRELLARTRHALQDSASAEAP